MEEKRTYVEEHNLDCEAAEEITEFVSSLSEGEQKILLAFIQGAKFVSSLNVGSTETAAKAVV